MNARSFASGACWWIFIGALWLPRHCCAENSPLEAALRQSAEKTAASASDWQIESTGLKGSDDDADFKITLRFAPPANLQVEYDLSKDADVSLDGVGSHRRRLFATDGSKMLIVQESRAGSDAALLSKFLSAELAKDPWIGVWFWPFFFQTPETKASDWSQRTSADGRPELFGEELLENVVITFGDRIDRPTSFVSIGRSGGFENTYEYSDAGGAEFSSYPVAGVHRRFYVRRKGTTLGESEPYDEYRRVTFQLIGSYRPISPTAAAFSGSLIPKGAFVTDQLADRTYVSGGNSRHAKSVQTLGDQLDVASKAGGTPLMPVPSRASSMTTGLVVLLAFIGGAIMLFRWTRARLT